MATPIQDLPGEIWKPVVGWEGVYEISCMGRVARAVSQYHPRHLLTPAREGAKRAHLAVTLYRSGCKRKRKVHHLVLEAFVGPRPLGAQCRHLNDDGGDNRVENLRWGSQAENMQDAIRNNRFARGAINGSAKLTARAVVAMRYLSATGVRNTVLAAAFGLSRPTVSLILRNKKWAWLQPDDAALARLRELETGGGV